MVSNPFQDGLSIQIDGDASGALDEFDTVMGAIDDVDGAIAGLGAALAGISAGGILRSIDAAANFESQMSESLAIVGDVGGELQGRMEDVARSIAKSTTMTADEAAQGFYFLASAGLTAEEQIAALPEIADFAAAGQLQMADASDYATDIMAAFGYEAGELGTVMDTLTATFTGHNQTAQGMGEAMSKVAPIAAGLGLSIDETSAIIGMFGDAGIKGSEAGTALRGALAALSDPTAEQQKLLGELGVKIRDSEGNMRSMTDIVGDLESAGADTTDIMRIFGQEAGPAMQVLLQEGSNALAENTDQIRESGGVTEEVANNQLDNFQSQWQILKSNVIDVGIGIGQVFLPILTDLAGYLTDAVSWFGDLNEATDGVAGAVALVSTFAVGLATAIKGLAPFLPPVTVALKGLLLLAGKLLVPIAVLAGLIYAWQTDFAGLRTQTMRVVDALREALQPAIEWLRTDGASIFDRIKNAVLDFVELATPYIETFITRIADGLIWTIETAADVFSTAFGIISGVITTAWEEVIQPFLTWFIDLWQTNLEEPISEAQKTFSVWGEAVGELLAWLETEIVGPFLSWFSQKVDETLGKIADWWNDHEDEIREIVEPFLNGLKELYELFVENITDALSGLFKVLRGDFEGAEEDLTEIWDRTLGKLVELAEWLYDKLVGNSVFPDLIDDILGVIEGADVKGAFFDVLDEAYRFVTGVKDDFFDAGEGLIDAIVDGVKDAPNAVKNAVEGVVGEARKYLPWSDAKEGPLSDLTASGASIPETIAKGVTSNMGALVSALRELELAPIGDGLASAVGSRSRGSGSASGSGDVHDTDIRIEVYSPDPGRAGDDVMAALDREFRSGL